MPNRAESIPRAAKQPSLWIGHALASTILVASLLLVLGYWRHAHDNGLRSKEADFAISNRQVLRLLEQRLINYELLMRGGVALQTSSQQLSSEQWQRYIAGLDLAQRIPSVQALGFALDLPTQQKPEALQAPSPQNGKNVPAAVHKSGDGRAYATVLYVAPQNADNQALVGRDLAAHPLRRRALEAAAAANLPRISEPLPSRSVTSQTAMTDMMIVAPVFSETGTIDAGTSAARGWVFLEFQTEALVREVLQTIQYVGQLRIVDTFGAQPRTVYANPKFVGSRAITVSDDERPAFSQSLLLEVLGRTWRVDYESPPLTQVRESIPGLLTTLVSGLLGSLLVFGIALTLVRTQRRAQALSVRLGDSYRRSEQRLHSAMHYSAIGIALLDEHGRVVEANPALAQILSTTGQALIGTPLGQYFVGGDQAEKLAPVQHETLADGAYRVTRRLHRRDGQVGHASLTFALVPGDIGHDVASLVQVEDVTERLHAEARVQALNRTLEARVALRTRELSHANRELEAFAYGISHDLRAPLRSIDGFSRLLSERYAHVIDANGQDYLSRIRKASMRMSELIDALLQMSRISRGELNHAQVDLSEMAGEILAELRHAEPARRVEFTITQGLRVHGDPVLLRNLMNNLLDNAWKFTCDRDLTRIEVGRNSAGELYVRDNGAGFASQYAAKLFQPFQRLHSQEIYSGHGIGLASVKRIIERHGGDIRAESKEGQGATFYFRIPDRDGEA